MSDGIPENSTTKIYNGVGFKVGLGIPIGVGLCCSYSHLHGLRIISMGLYRLPYDSKQDIIY